MLIGNVEKIDNYKQNISEQNIRVPEILKSNITGNHSNESSINQKLNQYKNEKTDSEKTNNIENFSKELNKDLNKNNKNITYPMYEANIYNQNFGYNTESKDFFIKVKRQEVELQYPTEEMMKMKIYFQEEMKKISS